MKKTNSQLLASVEAKRNRKTIGVVLVKCDACGAKHPVKTNLYTGWKYAKGYTIRCPYCGGVCKRVTK